MLIYLYVKTHNVTKLKYLGQTTSLDPHSYKGSGKRWIAHIKKHGYNVTTEILKECKTHEEVKEWGIYYSVLWNVAKSKEWANLKPEEGQGFARGIYNPMKSQNTREKTSKGMKRYLAEHPKTENQKKKHSEWNKSYWTEERRKNHTKGSTGTVSVTDIQGISKRISKTEYDNIDKTLPIEQRLYVSVTSKESKRRREIHLRTVKNTGE